MTFTAAETANRLARNERNERICALYLKGITVSKLARIYKLSRPSIYAILEASNIQTRGVECSTNRQDFLGVKVNQTVKDALLVEANKRDVSMAELTSNILSEMLTACGYPITSDVKESDGE